MQLCYNEYLLISQYVVMHGLMYHVYFEHVQSCSYLVLCHLIVVIDTNPRNDTKIHRAHVRTTLEIILGLYSTENDVA